MSQWIRESVTYRDTPKTNFAIQAESNNAKLSETWDPKDKAIEEYADKEYIPWSWMMPP